MSNIIVVGGQMENKGAQAMTYTVISEMKERYPEKNIIVVSVTDKLVSENDEKKYAFEILHINKKLKIELLGGVYILLSKSIKSSKVNNDKNKVEKTLKNTDMIIDISGYALSSQFSNANTINYLTNIMLAKKYNIPIYLFPQSFGPFTYNGVSKYLIKNLMRNNLKYPKFIFARELEGFNYIKEYTNHNLEKSFDIVLQGSNEYNINSIFNEGHYFNKVINIEIKVNSVAIVPNVKTIKHGNKKLLLDTYKYFLNHLLELNMNVYLLRHSTEDLELCKDIKGIYYDDKNVILLENEFDCIEVHSLFEKFNFIIASRYHSIIHAYKNGIPVIALGWAIKYQELLQHFEQQKYLFDVRQHYEKADYLHVLNTMVDKRDNESAKIVDKLEEIQKTTIFDKIFGIKQQNKK